MLSRILLIHGKYSDNEARGQQENAENSDIRVTRSGTSYYSSCPPPPTHHTSGHSNLPKSILKVTDTSDKIETPFYSTSATQRSASMRGLLMAKGAGIKLTGSEEKILSGNSSPFLQAPFTIKNIIGKRSKSRKLVRWNEQVEQKIGNSIAFVPLQSNPKLFKKCHYAKVALEPSGILSLSETCLLKTV